MHVQRGPNVEAKPTITAPKTGAGALGAGATLSTLLGTVSAEDATRDDLNRIEEAPGVREILDELSVERLPGPTQTEKRRIEDDGEITEGELVLWKVQIEPYGVLHAVEFEDQIGATFVFDAESSKAPKGYSAATEEHASMGASDSQFVFSRRVTDEEREWVLSVIDVDGEVEGARVFATTAVDGFQVKITVSSPESDGLETSEQVVTVDEDFDPRSQLLSEVITDENDPTDSLSAQPLFGAQQISLPSPRDVLEDILVDAFLDWFIGASLDVLGRECDDTCTSCAQVIVSTLGGCTTCRPLMGSSPSGVGAILLVACYYAWCGPLTDQVECAACFACLVTNDEPDVPSEADALAWVWDELPDPPSPPSLPL